MLLTGPACSVCLPSESPWFVLTAPKNQPLAKRVIVAKQSRVTEGDQPYPGQPVMRIAGGGAVPRRRAGAGADLGIPGRGDPTPLRDVPAADLWTFTLKDAGTRTLTTRGVRFRKRDYVDPWMTGQAGIRVRVRFMPHHDHRIEVYHAATGRYLGPADLVGQATEEQVTAVRRARAARARRLKKDLEASQREAYAAVNQPAAPQRLGARSVGPGSVDQQWGDLTTPTAPVRRIQHSTPCAAPILGPPLRDQSTPLPASIPL